VVYLRNPSMTINATLGVMTNTPISHSSIATVLSPMASTTFTQIRENFAYVTGVSPPDFFDSWSVPIQNFANLARALKEAGLKGICFDNEQYFEQWASYPDGVAYPAYTKAQYQTQARLRGKQVMEAMVAEFPDIVVITLHGPYISEPEAPWQLGFPGVVDGNAFMGPFFVGMHEGRGSQATNVDGGEIYWLRDDNDFAVVADWRRNDIASDAVDCDFIPDSLRPSWPDTISLSFGVYDMPSGGQAMSPLILASTLANALEAADQYVWFYTESMTFLKPENQGGATSVWVDAVRSVVPGGSPAGTPAPPPPAPSFTTSTSSDDDEERFSACGLLGIEIVPLLLAIRLLRIRSRRRS
jgi:hypothetical protein